MSKKVDVIKAPGCRLIDSRPMPTFVPKVDEILGLMTVSG